MVFFLKARADGVSWGREYLMECRPFLSPLAKVAEDLLALPADCHLRAHQFKSHT